MEALGRGQHLCVSGKRKKADGRNGHAERSHLAESSLVDELLVYVHKSYREFSGSRE